MYPRRAVLRQEIPDKVRPIRMDPRVVDIELPALEMNKKDTIFTEQTVEMLKAHKLYKFNKRMWSKQEILKTLGVASILVF